VDDYPRPPSQHWALSSHLSPLFRVQTSSGGSTRQGAVPTQLRVIRTDVSLTDVSLTIVPLISVALMSRAGSSGLAEPRSRSRSVVTVLLTFRGAVHPHTRERPSNGLIATDAGVDSGSLPMRSADAVMKLFVARPAEPRCPGRAAEIASQPTEKGWQRHGYASTTRFGRSREPLSVTPTAPCRPSRSWSRDGAASSSCDVSVRLSFEGAAPPPDYHPQW
jgi:hypothetical protein